ncbi:MAG TPA: nitronate monooxygenase [Kofleriaceae bacterium]|nr:nitronate monooxygenase [Kofleriaceae bacterium]
MTTDLRDLLSLEAAVCQAGMGGGISGAELAAAVANAGGLGTIGFVPVDALDRELTHFRTLAPDRSVAVNLLVPFARAAHVELCIARGVRAVVLFGGHAPQLARRLREAGIVVIHQIGTVEQARRAHAEGAQVLVVQGNEAGGHLLATEPVLAAVAAVRDALPSLPLIAAGGIVTADHVRATRAAGADGVLCGTRFLLTHESRAHHAYKARALGAQRTLETMLFGLGWPMRHRVLPNAATERWCRDDPRGPRWVRGLSALTTRLHRIVPGDPGALHRAQRLGIPLYTPVPPLEGDDDRLVEVSPLYAGTCARDIMRLEAAADIVRELSID